MTEKPILFSGPMIRAILENRKTKTRRSLKSQPAGPFLGFLERPVTSNGPKVLRAWFGGDLHSVEITCPYGKPGDRLWVRETLIRPDGDPWLYAADRMPVMVDPADETAMVVWAHHKEQDHCVSIHMHRWASRITLEITAVRVERLNDITYADVLAEGIEPVPCLDGNMSRNEVDEIGISAYARLWDSINGKKHPWASNLWVWVVEFRRIVRPANINWNGAHTQAIGECPCSYLVRSDEKACVRCGVALDWSGA